MGNSLNFAQAKLLANFCSDLAKGFLLAAASTPFVSREVWFLRLLLAVVSCVISVTLLKSAVELLEGVQE